jgi:predicted DNA-binding ribbon-helix-helix protein
LWQKEMRELNAGIFNLMKSARGGPMSVSSLIAKLDPADEHLESNLCSMLQAIRGTKQYWFQRQSEVKCMVREWGSPTILCRV